MAAQKDSLLSPITAAADRSILFVLVFRVELGRAAPAAGRADRRNGQSNKTQKITFAGHKIKEQNLKVSANPFPMPAALD